MLTEELAEHNLRLVARNLATLFRTTASALDKLAKLKKPKSVRLDRFVGVIFHRILFWVNKVTTILATLQEQSMIWRCGNYPDWLRSYGVATDPLAYDEQFYEGTSYKMSGDLVRLKYKYKVTHFKSKTEKKYLEDLESWDGFGVVVDTHYRGVGGATNCYADPAALISVKPLSSADPNVKFLLPSYALVIVRVPPSAHTIMRGAIMRERQSNRRGYVKKDKSTKVQRT